MHIKRKIPFTNSINKLGIVALISSLGFASVTTIWAIYLKSFLHTSSAVGFLIAISSIVSLFAYIFLVHIIEKNSKTKLYFMSLFIFILAYLCFSFLSNVYAIITITLLVSIIVSIRVTAFGILVSEGSKSNNLSKNEGVIYTFFNLAWLVGPLIAGFLSAKYGISAVFLIAAIFVFLALSLFKSFKIGDKTKKNRKKESVFRILKEFFQNSERRKSYFLSGGINFWWAFIYVYIPMFIIESGFSPRTVGYFLFGVIIPLILFTYIFGKMAGKIGFKKIFFTGYIILGIVSFTCFFFSNLTIILILLILASVGASMLECTTEAHFFDIIKENQKDKYYGPYNTTIDLNYSIASFGGAILLSFLSFKYIFIFFGIVMISLALLSLKIREIIEAKRISN